MKEQMPEEVYWLTFIRAFLEKVERLRITRIQYVYREVDTGGAQ